MNGMILATYVLKAQQQSRRHDRDPVAFDEKTNESGLRALVSLLVSFAGLAIWVAALDALK